MTAHRVKIGTCGYSYKDWLGNFYPQFCPQADFLRFYSSRFKTVEIDASFYRLPSEDTVKKWARVTPEDFVLSAKFPQSVTHEGTKETRIEAARAFVEVMKQLGCKRGPLLLQFPYGFKPDQEELLAAIIRILPENERFAVELRNKRWLENDRILDLLKSKNIAYCLIDHPWMPRTKTRTADFQYVRLLGDRSQIESDFSFVRFDRGEELRWWGELLTECSGDGITCYVYLNNHFSGHAPTTADSLITLTHCR